MVDHIWICVREVITQDEKVCRRGVVSSYPSQVSSGDREELQYYMEIRFLGCMAAY